MDAGTFRNGFATDPDTDANLIPIIFFVNLAVRLIASTGILQTEVSFATASGTLRYAMPSGIGKMEEVLFGDSDRPLRNVTLKELQNRERDTWNSVFGEPNCYYTIGQRIGFFPNPHTVGPCSILTHSLSPDLVAATDTLPASFPLWYYDAVPIIAALLLCASDAQNTSSAQRIGFLTSLSDQMYPELSAIAGARSIIIARARRESGPSARTEDGEE